MIVDKNYITGRLSGNSVLVAKKPDQFQPDSREQKITEQLRQRDIEVRAHESSHGNDPNLIKIGAAQYDYTIGPDGKAYATGGKTILATGRGDTPGKALMQAEALKKASMAPGEPSHQDFGALSAAIAMEYEARSMVYSENRIHERNHPQMKGIFLNTYA